MVSNSVAPGSCAGGPVAAYPPDDLPCGHRARQVHVAQRDVVREALQEPQRHRAGGGIGGDVHGLVTHHHLGSARPEAAEDLRVDEDVHRRVRGEGTVRGDVTAAIWSYSPGSAVQRLVQCLHRRRHLHHQARLPAREHRTHHRDRRAGASRVGVRLARIAAHEDQCVGAAVDSRRGVVIHSGERRSPPPMDVTTTWSPETEAEADLGHGRSPVEAAERPGRVDGGLPDAVVATAPQLVDVPQREVVHPRAHAVLDQVRQLLTGLRRRSGSASASASSGRPSATASSSALRASLGERWGRGPGLVVGGGCDASVVVERHPGDEPHDQEQRQRKAGHPPTWATGLCDVWVSQGGRRRSTASRRRRQPRTPVPGFAACTIMPLPMYMPTWLIGW